MNNKVFTLFFFAFLFSISCSVLADTMDDIKAIAEVKVKELDNGLKNKFNQVYKNWRKSCTKEFPLSSDTRDCRKASGYQELKNMGNKVIPLYIDLLLNSQDFFALVPYDEVQDNHLIVQHKFPKSEQRRAIETVIVWLADIICSQEYEIRK